VDDESRQVENLPHGSNPPQVIEAVRKVLAGVARMCQRGQFGKKLLAAMLIGSTATRVTKLGLNRLSTHGILSELTEDEVTELIDALLRLRLLAQVEIERFKPVMELTARGTQVMKGEVELKEIVPLNDRLRAKLGVLRTKAEPAKTETKTKSKKETSPEPNSRPAPPPDDFDPFAEVNAEYGEPSAASDAVADRTIHPPHATPAGSSAGKMPAPRERGAGFQPANISPVKMPGSNETPAGETPASRPSHISSPHYWTYRVLAAGFTPDECRQIRKLDDDTIFDHILRAAREGHAVQAAWVLSPEQIAKLDQAIGDGEQSRINAVLAKLPAGIKYRDVQLYLLSRGIAGDSSENRVAKAAR
jgi:ATP-dependent DNA helicase RecQ